MSKKHYTYDANRCEKCGKDMPANYYGRFCKLCSKEGKK